MSRSVRTLVILVGLATAVSAADLTFNKDIRPILSDRCYACHGPDRNNRKANFRLDVEADAKADRGKGKFGIVPGHADQSEIYKRITSTNKTLRMPPAYLGHDKLTDREIERIK